MLADRIAAEHAAMTVAWRFLRPALAAIGQGDASLTMQGTRSFAAQYREHLALEEHSVFARVQSTLDDRAQRDMGREMARRRGVAC